MKVLIQRVSRAQVSIDGTPHSKIGRGFVVFLGIRSGDTEADASSLARKTAHLRIFRDEQDRMNLSLIDTQADALVISQFTLYADTRKGSRPGFTQAETPLIAQQRYNLYVESLSRIIGPEHVQTGRFRSSMQVELVNDGPVTIKISTDD